ncbi:hypothetical protein D6817_00150 [Candidatus Pacearchaeota archaeon]|nr:MAG: hypothetical protein D6817_00150 [Candidatus Pacearchaeota archaeon]
MPRTEYEFPQGLEARLGAVMNAVNTEYKSLALLATSDVPQEAREIRKGVREMVGTGVRLPQQTPFEKYFKLTLVPIGMVAREEILSEGAESVKVGYCLTCAGKRYGQPIAAYAIKWSVENGLSMHEVLGSTHSRGERRSPENRVNILKCLARAYGSLRGVDIVRKLNMDHTVICKHLLALAKIGFVEYDSVGYGKPRVTYSLREQKEPVKVKKYGRQTPRIYEFLRQNRREFTIEEVAQAVGCAYSSALAVLSGLEKQGITKREKWKGGELQSEVRITRKGREFLEGFVRDVERILSDDEQAIRGGRELMRVLHQESAFGDYFARAAELYALASPQVNAKSFDERRKEVIGFLRASGEATAKEIAEEMGVGVNRARNILRPLSRAGVVKRRKKKGRLVYFVEGEEEKV